MENNTSQNALLKRREFIQESGRKALGLAGLVLLTQCGTADDEPGAFNGSLSLLAPVGGSVLRGGLFFDIAWQATGLSQLKLEYSSNQGQSWNLIANNLPASEGSYAWNVPNEPLEAVILRLSGVDNPAAEVQSPAPFKIRYNYILRESEFPALTTVGGFASVDISLLGSFIVFRTETGYFALSRICTHAGCDVGWQSAQNQFVCPCHGSRYNAQGQVIQGPAPDPLGGLATEYEADLEAVLVFEA
ncbi:MAG: hypothetical protein OHK0053_27240 [Microscillaceae bacterium]